MAVIRNSVVLRCTPETAFDYLSDPRSELEWSPQCEAMEKMTDGPVGVGTVYRAKWKGSPPVELEIVHFDRPHTWTGHSRGGIEVIFTGTLEAVPEGTRFRADFRPRAHGWYRLIFPLFLVMVRRGERAAMGHIRDALERRHQAQTPP